MRETAIKILRLTLGWTCVLLGIIGLFVPILQGIFFILVGLWMLSRESRLARRCLLRLRLRYPAADRQMRIWQRRVRQLKENWNRDRGRRCADD